MGNHGEFGKAMRHSLEENYGVPYETWCSHFLQNAFPEITASTGEFARALGCPLSRVGCGGDVDMGVCGAWLSHTWGRIYTLGRV